jgi:hypothetical protein
MRGSQYKLSLDSHFTIRLLPLPFHEEVASSDPPISLHSIHTDAPIC